MSGDVLPADFEPTAESLAQVRENIIKAGVVGRLVANDFSGALGERQAAGNSIPTPGKSSTTSRSPSSLNASAPKPAGTTPLRICTSSVLPRSWGTFAAGAVRVVLFVRHHVPDHRPLRIPVGRLPALHRHVARLRPDRHGLAAGGPRGPRLRHRSHFHSCAFPGVRHRREPRRADGQRRARRGYRRCPGADGRAQQPAPPFCCPAPWRWPPIPSAS